MDIRAAFIADGQPAVSVQPRQRALHHPTMPPQTVIPLDALAGDPHLHVVARQVLATPGDVIGLVGVDLDRACASLPRGALDWWDRLQHRLEQLTVMPVGAADQRRQGESLLIDDQMVLGTGFPPIRRVGTGQFAPLFAGTLALSTHARSQSIWSASPSWSSNA